MATRVRARSSPGKCGASACSYPTAADDAEGQARMAAFLQGLAQLGWSEGRNLRIDTRWGGGDADRGRRYAAELVALAPDVILASGGSVLAPLLQATRSAALASEASGQRGNSKVRAPDTRPEPGSSARTLPMVFTIVADPVGAGLVNSLARPGGNITGFTGFDYSLSGKWLELLKQIAPGVTRAAVIRDPAIIAGIGQWGAIHTAAPAIGVEVIPVNVRDARRDRACRRGLRALSAWRPDRDGERVGGGFIAN